MLNENVKTNSLKSEQRAKKKWFNREDKPPVTLVHNPYQQYWHRDEAVNDLLNIFINNKGDL